MKPTPSHNFASKLAALLTVALLATASSAQVDDGTATEPVKRERIVIKISHLPVKTIEEALLRVSTGSDLLVIGEANTNKLVIDAPTSAVPNALGLIRELDRPQQMVNISVTEVLVSDEAETRLKAMPTKQLQNQLKELSKTGDGKVINRMQLSGMTNTSVRIQNGAQKPSVTSASTRGGGRGGIPGRSFTYNDVGTTFTGTPRITENAVLLNFQFETSDTVEGEDADMPGSIVTTKFESTVRIPTGEVVVVGGTRSGPDGRPVQWQLILSAEVVAIE